MYISEKTLDDLMHEVLSKLLIEPFNVNTTRGVSSEIRGILLHLENPRARLSRTETKGKPFSALGELLWYLSKKNDVDFISYYLNRYRDDSEDGSTIFGGYGPRLFNMRNHDQVVNIIKLLENKPSSRRAVIQLFNAEDIAEEHLEIPCTCTLQFMIRDGQLYLFTSMRSNDAFWGLPHDIFAFTMLQEIVARSLSVELGTYSHFVGSLHLYEKRKLEAKQYLEEGLQSTNILMENMPKEDPWPAIHSLLKAELIIRSGDDLILSDFNLSSYWLDLIRLLQIHSFFKNRNFEKIIMVKNQMESSIYDEYVNMKLDKFK